MQTILPITVPPIETYQDESFIRAIILAYRNLSDTYYNNYINMECNVTDDIYDLKLLFTNATWEDYRIAGLADMNMYYIRNLSSNKFDGFIRERIDQGNYIIMYCVDEYFLSYTTNYKSTHYIHDTYIYGYDDNVYYVLAYKDRKLQQIQVRHEEVTKALFSQGEKRDNVSFCTFRPSSTVNVSIDIAHIMQEYARYRNSEASGTPLYNKRYGIGVYEQLEKCVQKLIDEWKVSYVSPDLRPFRCIWEHKKTGIERMKRLRDFMDMSGEETVLLEELESITHKLFLIMIKFDITKDKTILDRSIQYIHTIKELELRFLSLIGRN